MDGVNRAGVDVSALLQAWGQGHIEARDRVMEVVYQELRRRAAAYLRRERAGHTLQPTALVHEAYLRLVDQNAAAGGIARSSSVSRHRSCAASWWTVRERGRLRSGPAIGHV